MPYSENAINVFKKLYFRYDETKPAEVFLRVANYVADGDEELAKQFLDMMNENIFRPNTPALMNCGVMKNPQTSACFVSGMDDSLVSILDMDREAALIFASGSGIGVNFSVLREKDAVLTSGGASSGPFAFIKKLAATADAVKSGGVSRRAAILIMFFDNHPDLMEFITLKDTTDQKTLRSMNLSIAISNDFMKAVQNDSDWELRGVVDNKVKSMHKARDIFNLIANNAFKSGDPGVWFIDTVNKDNSLIEEYGKMISTNPCGEISGLNYYACSLASINLTKFAKVSSKMNIDSFDWEKFKIIVRLGVIFLDKMISVSGYPSPNYDEMAKAARPIGLGIMGLADLLCMLNIPYNSFAAYELSEKITRFMTKVAIETSIELAQEYGPCEAFENNQEGIRKLCSNFDVDLKEGQKVRNSNWTTIAPTGSISISADCSPGMEPLFGITYTKNIADSNEKWVFVNPLFENFYGKESWYAKAIKEIAENHGSCQGISCVPLDVQKVWKVAHDIKWQDRIEMQSHLQKGISNSISSTANLPSTATVEDIKDIYMMAWQKGLKGVTIYRDGSLEGQPVEFKQEKKEEKIDLIRNRPKIRNGTTYTMETGHGSIHITINKDLDGNVFELFAAGGKGGNVNAASLEAVGRLSSLALQKGAEITEVSKQLLGISDGRVTWDKLHPDDDRTFSVLSIWDAIGQVLNRFYALKPQAKIDAGKPTVKPKQLEQLRCPDCGADAFMKEGCVFCPNCGSKCS
jgi:ribonucleoside-diphosphate reductase alpha chain